MSEPVAGSSVVLCDHQSEDEVFRLEGKGRERKDPGAWHGLACIARDG